MELGDLITLLGKVYAKVGPKAEVLMPDIVPNQGVQIFGVKVLGKGKQVLLCSKPIHKAEVKKHGEAPIEIGQANKSPAKRKGTSRKR
jgi:hypothetical protein